MAVWDNRYHFLGKYTNSKQLIGKVGGKEQASSIEWTETGDFNIDFSVESTYNRGSSSHHHGIYRTVQPRFSVDYTEKIWL